MKRKTNLFYTEGQDSNFITFSNYTEALTGNYLATDVKLFPSKFICAYIPVLENSDNKEEFIQRLAAHYENKVAFLRDLCAERGYNVEEKMRYLGWLIDSLNMINDEMGRSETAETTNSYSPLIEYNHIGAIVEQDYNGIYADTICMIDASEAEDITIETVKSSFSSIEPVDQNKYLYGWYTVSEQGDTEYIGPANWKNVKPIFDGEVASSNYYTFDTAVKQIEAVYNTNPKDIKFNVIIPLFDIINVNHKHNTDIIKTEDKITLPCDDNTGAILNVPYGIWFSKETITLTRDNTQWSPTWSLSIGSQFKPFPYYNKQQVNEIDQSAKTAAFSTFAQVLTRQNTILDKISDTYQTIAYIGPQAKQLINDMSYLNNKIDGKQDELTFDEVPIANSNNPVTSNGTYVAINNVLNKIDTINTYLDNKQDALTFDNTPTANSDNPVKSKGIKSAIDGVQATIDSMYPTDNLARISKPGMYFIGISGTLLPNPQSDGTSFLMLVFNVSDTRTPVVNIHQLLIGYKGTMYKRIITYTQGHDIDWSAAPNFTLV